MSFMSRLSIAQDYRKLWDNMPWGLEAHPVVEDKLSEWIAVIHGLRNTDWEGGIFRLFIRYTEDYNDGAPKILFHSIPFHPNIDAVSGEPNLDFLNDPSKWNPSFDLLYILVALQNLLSSPSLEDSQVANEDAANLLLFHPSEYQQRVRQCVAASQALFASEGSQALDLANNRLLFGSTAAIATEVSKVESATARTCVSAASRHHQRIPFEDYHKTWCGIATSKPDAQRNGSSKDDDNYLIQRANCSSSSTERADQTKHQKKPAIRQDAELRRRMDRVERMKQVYLQRHATPQLTSYSSRSPKLNVSAVARQRTTGHLNLNQFDEEVDNLVMWTNNLDF